MRILYTTFYMVCLSILIGVQAFSQSEITADVSQNITNFSFTNSLGDKVKDYNPNYSSSYMFGYRYNMENGLFFPFKLGMRKAGATYILDNSNYSWDLQYAETRLGAGYKYSLGNIGIHASLSGYMGFLLKAKQTLNNENFDIKESGDILKSDFGFVFSPGIDYPINDKLTLYFDLNYLVGLKNIEANTDQKSKNRLFGATLGVSFAL